jgi:predicted Fe-Mo cluster-binding NifX family protein
MKIAIPTDDKQTIAGHFGRTLGFKVFEVAGDKITGEEYRENTFTGHARGQHGHHHGEHHGPHSHKGILDNLGDCDTIVARGMGKMLIHDLTNAGKKIFITQEGIIDEALKKLMEGNLDHNESYDCKH